MYKQLRKPKINEILHCKEDKRAEAKVYDTNTVGVYVTDERRETENTLAGHVPIEPSRLLTLFLQENSDNPLTATVKGKRKREVGLVVPANFTAFTQELKNVKILKKELNERASRYTHPELKKITIDENKFPLQAYHHIAAIAMHFYHLKEILE